MKSTALTARAVADAVPQALLDYFYWPCIAGEDFPPDFVSGAQYSSLGIYPCVEIDANASQEVQWPAIPLNSPRSGAMGFTASFQLTAPALAKGESVAVVLGAGIGLSMFRDNSAVGFTTMSLDGVQGPVISQTIDPTLWHQVSIVMAPDTTFTLTVDQQAAGAALPITPPASTLAVLLRTSPGAAVLAYLTALTVSWP